MKSYDVIVVGVGGWGSAAMAHLARRGLKVCGIEQFALGHDRGSSHGESRVIRRAYFMDPAYLPVLDRAYTLWRDLEIETGQPLMTLTGLLCAGEPDGPFIRGLEQCYAAQPRSHQRWTAEEAHTQFPQFNLPEETACYWDPEGGYLRADACIHAHVAVARKLGAELFTGERVFGIECDGDSVIVRTDRGTRRAAKVVVTVGAFAQRMFGSLGTLVKPRRKVFFWYRPPDPAAFDRADFPVWIAKLGGLNYYGFPSFDGQTIKAAEDTGGQPVDDPYHVPTQRLPEDEVNLRPFLEGLFGNRLGPTVDYKTCMYEDTVDRDFIVDWHPTQSNVLFAFGGSGHGFKFCSVIGESVADLITEGSSNWRPPIFELRDRAQAVAVA